MEDGKFFLLGHPNSKNKELCGEGAEIGVFLSACLSWCGTMTSWAREKVMVSVEPPFHSGGQAKERNPYFSISLAWDLASETWDNVKNSDILLLLRRELSLWMLRVERVLSSWQHQSGIESPSHCAGNGGEYNTLWIFLSNSHRYSWTEAYSYAIHF